MVRVRNLHETLQSAEQMARVPLSLENEVHKLLREDNLDIFDLDAGLDLVVTLDPESADDEPQFLGAFSLPIKDLEQTRRVFEREGFPVDPLVPGVYRSKVLVREDDTEPSAGPEDFEDDFDIGDEAPKETYCDLAMSVGDAPARIVCSDSTDELDTLRPWLTRGLPAAPLADHDFHADVRFAPFRDRYVPVARAQLPGVEFLAKRWLESELDIREPRLLAIPGQIMQEALAVVDDLDRVALTGKLAPNASEMRFTAKIAFRNKTSWLTQVYTDANDEAGPPPQTFWRLPRGADSATYARAADPKHYEGIKDTLRLLTAELLEKTPLSARARSSLEAFVATTPVHGGTVISARGTVLPDAKTVATKGVPTPQDAVRAVEQLAHSSFGWTIIGVEAPATDYAQWLDKGATAYRRVIREAKRDKDIGADVRDAKWLPTVRVRKYLAGYPRGSMGLDITVKFDSRQVWVVGTTAFDDVPNHPKGPAARGQVKLRIVVVPDGANRAWLGLSTDNDLLKDKMKVVLDSGKNADRIASMPGLEPLRSTPTIAAGYVSYGNLVSQTVQNLRQDLEVDPARIEKVMSSLPNRLRTPILLLHTATTGRAPVHEIQFRVQRGTVEDIAGLVKLALSEEGRKLIDSIDDDDEASGEEKNAAGE